MESIEKKLKSFMIVSLVLLTSAAAYADDGLTPGPGLFSGESGEFSITGILSKQTAKPSEDLEQVEVNDIEAENLGAARKSLVKKGKAEEKVTDFEIYKEWRALRNAAPEVYTDFELYLEYKTLTGSYKKNSN